MPGITYDIGLNAQSFLNGMNRMKDAAGTAKTAVSTAFAGMSGAASGLANVLWKLPDQMRALGGILQGLSLPAKLAGSAETTSVAFRVLIGDATKAEEVLGRIRDLAARTPFEFPELADAARKLAAFGEEADSIPDTLRRVGDIASATGSGISELAELYGKARVQGTLFAEDINQLTGRGVPIIQAFAQQLGITNAEVKKLASEGKIGFTNLEQAFKDLTGEGGKFSGMMGEISKTFEGKLSTLQDSIKTLLTEMGKGINEGLKPVMDELTSQLDTQQGLARSIGESIGYGIEVGLEIIKSGQIGEVLSTQFQAAGLELVSTIVKGFSIAGEALADAIMSGLESLNNIEILGVGPFDIKRGNKSGALGGVSQDEVGIDSLNQAARDARARANDALSGSITAVDRRRAVDAFYGERSAKAQADKKAQAEAQAADASAARDAADLDARTKAEARANAVAAAGGEEAYLDLTDPGRIAEREARANAVAAAGGEANYLALTGQAPAGGAAAATAAADVSQSFGGGAADVAMDAAGISGGEARKRIKGARFAAGAASGLGAGNAYRGQPGAAALDRQTGRSLDRRTRRESADRANRAADDGSQKEQQRDQILRKLLKSVEEIERKIRNPDPKAT